VKLQKLCNLGSDSTIYGAELGASLDASLTACINLLSNLLGRLETAVMDNLWKGLVTITAGRTAS